MLTMALIIVPSTCEAGVQKRSAKRVAFAVSKSFAFGLQAPPAGTMIKAILAEHLGHGRILSTDERYFRTYRWKNHKPFENLLIG